MNKRYAKLSENVLGFLLAFPNSYMVEEGFSHTNALLTMKRSRLDVGQREIPRVKLTNFQPNIQELIRIHQLHPSHWEMCFLGKLLN